MSSTTHPQKISALVVGAIGVVYGDIGTSPLYALRECFYHEGAPHADALHLLGVLSLIFWSVMLVVSLKYVTIIMRADNKGEGGTLALLALVGRLTKGSPLFAITAVLGIFATSLFYGDSMITPAISVLSAVEGLQIIAPDLAHFTVPITVTILFLLFAIQRFGTAIMGKLFGPIMIVWFLSLGILGIISIAQTPEVLIAINPMHAITLFATDPIKAFLLLGAVVLALTGAEALYADMGHFGRKPIKLAWFLLVMPCLLLNYFGQGGLLLRDVSAITNPFYLLVPEMLRVPMIGLATAATVIASQAVISGAFSVTQQAIQLGYLPRMRIIHTSAVERGQIYIPAINNLLLVFVIALVIGFQSSSNLAAAYGVAVTGTMLICTMLISIVMVLGWRWHPLLVLLFLVTFLFIDGLFFAANAIKILEGGWLPLAIGIGIFVVLTTWKRGRILLFQRLAEESLPVETLLNNYCVDTVRVKGNAVFLTGATEGVPHALLQNLRHNHILHERVILLTVVTNDVPHVPESERLQVHQLGWGFYRVFAHFGFMDTPDVPQALRLAAEQHLPLLPDETSYFLARETLIPTLKAGMALWREKLFAWLSHHASAARDYYKLPPNRVIELGAQIEI